ncbi:MAG: Eco57I restriction-modification methylase domain-containing protein, partial [Epsilonproteobacteria bacterium]|nr:Eco57I restriction-modification methylase domain-containing protein [Campylobacterota bacterium]
SLVDYDPFNPLSVAGFFDSDFMFNIKDGFDIVIGNPPYIKEYTNKKAFDRIRENKKYYQGKMDIWYFFTCVGIDLLKTNGVLSFIAPNNWITNSGASKLRNKVLEDTQILEFIDFGDFKVFESADIQTMVMNLQATKNNNEYDCMYSKLLDKEYPKNKIEDFLNKKQNENFLVSKTHIIKCELKDKNINFSEDKHFVILNKIEKSKNFDLTDLEVANGIHTHHSEVNKKMLKIDNSLILKEGIFVVNDKEKEQLNLSQKELELIKPLYTSEQINGYFVNSENKFWIIYTDSSFKNIETIKPYPNIKKHLDRFSQVITSDNKPYGLHRARNKNFFVGEKIASLRKCPNRPSFSYINFDCYLGAEYYLIKSNRINLKYLTSILNSKLIAYWLKHKGKMQGNNYQIDKEPILNIPIKNIDDTKPFEILVDYIIFLKQQEFNQNDDLKFAKDRMMVSFFERLIDCMVYELYFAD